MGKEFKPVTIIYKLENTKEIYNCRKFRFI